MDIVYFPVGLLLLLLPVIVPLKIVVLCLILPSSILKSLQTKDLRWKILSHTWSGFFQPFVRIEFAAIGFISLIIPEYLMWVLAAYLTLLPLIVWITVKWLKATITESWKEDDKPSFFRT